MPDSMPSFHDLTERIGCAPCGLSRNFETLVRHFFRWFHTDRRGVPAVLVLAQNCRVYPLPRHFISKLEDRLPMVSNTGSPSI